MHPQLLPEKHPMCGKVGLPVCMFTAWGRVQLAVDPLLSGRCPLQYMEALVACREANPLRRYWGECNEITWKLSKCLVEQKKMMRSDRQAK
jgi:hypothetical protein